MLRWLFGGRYHEEERSVSHIHGGNQDARADHHGTGRKSQFMHHSYCNANESQASKKLL
jgi:hypothetical protein